MRTPNLRPESLRHALALAGTPTDSVLSDGDIRIPLQDALAGSIVGMQRKSLYRKNVLVAVATQLEAALTLIDLDGFAARLVLVPPDVKAEHMPAIVRDASVDAIICSNLAGFGELGPSLYFCGEELEPLAPEVEMATRTEWLMLTSGTTGDPKIAVHTLDGLTGAIPSYDETCARPVWATFYDIRRYGGLQIFLRAILGGASLLLSRPGEPVADHLTRLAAEGATHVSGTPTHWRRALMSASAAGFMPSYVRLSGEIADQAILDALRAGFPNASIGHAYASTEAGVGFEVNDGYEGFPASYLDEIRTGVEMRVVDGSLRIRSNRKASHYAGRPDLELADRDGWVDTGDIVDQRGDRCYFAGRRGGIINVGGLKVHPEEIETVINRHGAVRQSRVRPRKSPIIGAIVVADIVLKEDTQNIESVKQDIMALCRSNLPPHKIPALLNIVANIEMTSGGKVSRQHA